MLASRATRAIRHSLSKDVGDLAGRQGGDDLELLNELGQAFFAVRPWGFLKHSATPLHLIAGQPWLDLPDDFEELIGQPKPAQGLTQELVPSSLDEILDLRSTQLTVVPSWTYYWALEYAAPSNKNLLASTENLADTNFWETVSSATATANSGTGPTGKNDATQCAAAGSASGRIAQDVAFDDLTDGAVYLGSLYVFAGTATQTDIEIQQQGAGGTPETTTTMPKTVMRIAWSGGVPTATLQSSQGPGDHSYGVSSIGGGWYRAWVALTFIRQRDMPSEEVRFAIRPDSASASGNVLAWGAQLERFDQSADDEPFTPSPYSPNLSTVTDITGPTVRRLAIWPTPQSTSYSAFSLHYRRAWVPITDESQSISIPGQLDPLFLETLRVCAKGIYEEDDGAVHQRMESLLRSQMWSSIVERETTVRRVFGRPRNEAAYTPDAGGRTWIARDVTLPD